MIGGTAGIDCVEPFDSTAPCFKSFAFTRCGLLARQMHTHLLRRATAICLLIPAMCRQGQASKILEKLIARDQFIS